jgi:hypothetical protein
MFAQQPILVEILVEQKIVSQGLSTLSTLSTNSSSAAKSCHPSATLLLSVVSKRLTITTISEGARDLDQ